MREGKTSYRARSQYRNKDYARNYDYSRYQHDKRKRRRDIATRRALAQAFGRLGGCTTVLDMPCGTGRLAKTIVEAGYWYVGCDIAQEMLRVFLERLSGVAGTRVLAVDGEDLPFAANTFDCIVCVRFLNLVPSEPRLHILKEFYRVSKQYLLIATGYFGKARPIKEDFCSRFSWLLPKAQVRQKKHQALRRELAQAGWSEHLWIPYKSRGLFSTTKMIGVFMKKCDQP